MDSLIFDLSLFLRKTDKVVFFITGFPNTKGNSHKYNILFCALILSCVVTPLYIKVQLMWSNNTYCWNIRICVRIVYYALAREPSSDWITYKYNIIIMLHYLLVSIYICMYICRTGIILWAGCLESTKNDQNNNNNIIYIFGCFFLRSLLKILHIMICTYLPPKRFSVVLIPSSPTPVEFE